MSCFYIDVGATPESDNVVRLQPPGGSGSRNSATAAQGAPALEAVSFQPDAITRDGLDLLKAFFAIGDESARSLLVAMAQKLAALSGKK